MLLLVWLIRYLDYLITAAKLSKTLSENHIGAGALVHDMPLGLFVVLFIPAWMYRAINHRVRKEWAVFLTIFVELLLESALVMYSMLYLYLAHVLAGTVARRLDVPPEPHHLQAAFRYSTPRDSAQHSTPLSLAESHTKLMAPAAARDKTLRLRPTPRAVRASIGPTPRL